MGCGCSGGGANRPAQAPRLPVNVTSPSSVTSSVADAARMHPSAINLQNIQRLAEERRKLSKLKREQLLKALSKP